MPTGLCCNVMLLACESGLSYTVLILLYLYLHLYSSIFLLHIHPRVPLTDLISIIISLPVKITSHPLSVILSKIMTEQLLTDIHYKLMRQSKN